MPTNLGYSASSSSVRLSAPAERIRCAIERRRPTLTPRGLDAAACAVAAMYAAAYGHMATSRESTSCVARVDGTATAQGDSSGAGAAAPMVLSTLATSVSREDAGGVEGHADSPKRGEIGLRSALPGDATGPTDQPVGPTPVAGIKPGPASSLPTTSPTITPHRSSTRATPEERPAGAACEHPAGLEVA